jgi:aminoglycoside phosphotransferase family enzyme
MAWWLNNTPGWSRSRKAQGRLVDAMTRPGFYSDRPSQVEVKQTHMSSVCVVGEHVYQVKKPVRFDFADCSTLGVRMGGLTPVSLP